ncbi:Rhodanese- sulfurtransferase [Dimargaris cristalligena]|nr:Rhodanese- sulfurtransferase [Dimargaris cristalligena]
MDVSSALEAHKKKFKTTEVEKVIPLDIDLGLLTASDINVLDDSLLKSKDTAALNKYLRRITRDGAQLLINSIFSRPTRTTEDSVIAELPKPFLKLPREKHVPKPKPLTRWEKFAQTKGIQSTKRSQKVFDEATGEYLPRWGYRGVNDAEKQWLVEVKDGADPFQDQFQKLRDEKKERVNKNQRRHQRNLEESAAEQRSISNPRSMQKKDLQRTLVLSKSSTASMGKFDRQLVGEPKVKGVKRKFKSNDVDAGEEKDTSLKLLKKVVDAPKGKIDVHKAIRKLKK